MTSIFAILLVGFADIDFGQVLFLASCGYTELTRGSVHVVFAWLCTRDLHDRRNHVLHFIDSCSDLALKSMVLVNIVASASFFFFFVEARKLGSVKRNRKLVKYFIVLYYISPSYTPVVVKKTPARIVYTANEIFFSLSHS